MIIIFIALYIATYYAPDGIAYGLCVEGLIVSLALSSFFKTPYTKPLEKSGWFCICLYTLANALCFAWFDESVMLSKELFICESVFFVTMYLYSCYRSYDIPSDQYSTSGVFIVLKRPCCFLDYLISLMFVQVSSVSVVIDGEKYGYKICKPFSRKIYEVKASHSLIKINIDPQKARNLMLCYMGLDWSMKYNCCKIAQKLFPSYKFKLIDSLPSYMAKTILKIRSL
jgi:hypothetical protein